MTGALNLLTGDVMQALGWTLVHFLWQGAAIALLLSIILACSRRASVRYSAALAALLLIAASPIATFFVLRSGSGPALESSSIAQAWNAMEALPNSPVALPPAVNAFQSVDWLSWLVCAWLGGVLLFAIRALGGWVFLERLRREKAQPIAASLLRRCLSLQQRLGLTRTVRYLGSQRIDSPAVVGWFRPVILLPLTALTGLSPEQLEAVIAHELAHIQRLDCFVNLFQIAVETALFYHPAVWWISRTIRNERENCCDDIAVLVCGNACTYAKALTLMETWRATPALVLAANSGALKSRVARLLGLHNMTHSVPRAGLGVIGVLCAAGALLASTTFNASFSHPSDPNLAPPVNEQSPAPDPPEFVAQTAPAPSASPAAPPAPPAAAPPAPPAATPEPPEPPSSESYIDGLHSAGLTNLSVNDLIALKVHGVTPEYIRQMRAAGVNLSVHELLSLKALGVDPEYVRDIRATGLNPSPHELAGMKAVGVTPEYVRKIRSEWSDVTAHELMGLRAEGVDPGDAAQFRQLGLKDFSVHQLASFKALGVTPDYIRAMKAAGFSNLSAHEYVSAKALGITPEFIQKVHSHGFNNLTMRQLIGLKTAGVF